MKGRLDVYLAHATCYAMPNGPQTRFDELNEDKNERPRTAHLRLIATTDMHGALLPYDYVRDVDAAGAGLDGLIDTIAAARKGCAATLLVDNGDFLQGTPMTDVIAASPDWRDTQTHPVITAMNALEYDAVALGNHEFNFGLEVLDHALSDLKCPSLCSNILDAATGTPFVAPWTILEKPIGLSDGTQTTIKIGLIAFAPPQIAIWDSLICKNRIAASPIVSTAQKLVPDLKAAGADVIIALCHSGLGAVEDSPDIENAAIPLAAVDGIDAIVMGHTHLAFPNDEASNPPVDAQRATLHGKPAVMPRALAKSLGCIDFTLNHGTHGWAISGFDTFHLGPAETSGHLMQMPALKRAHEATLDLIRTPIGSITAPMNSYFARVANCPTIAIVGDAQERLARSVLAQSAYADLPILSAIAPFKAGGRMGADYFIDIPKGPVALRHIAELYVFPNVLCLASFTGAEIENWLERSAGMFNQIKAGHGAQGMIDPTFPSYNFDVLVGLTYSYDLSQPSRFDGVGGLLNPQSRRLRDLRFKGHPVKPDDRFVIASNSYRIGGGGAFFAPDPTRDVINTQVLARDALADHFRASSPIAPRAEATWGFAPIKDASGLFQTSPSAVGVADSVKDRRFVGFEPSIDGYVIGEIAFD